jgi:AcrR family transcriptional regulator
MARTTGERQWHRGLDRDAVVAEALRILDSEGREALTMRRLAKALDVEAASLYAHVASKDELVDAVLDRVLAEVPVPEPGDDSRASLALAFRGYRRTLLAHPQALILMTERARPSEAQMRLAGHSIALLERAGLTMRQAVDAHVTLIAYTLGFMLQEVARPVSPPPLGLVVPPIVVRAYAALAERPVDERFDVGFDLILDGVGVARR